MTYEEFKAHSDVIAALNIVSNRHHTFSRSKLEKFLLNRKKKLVKTGIFALTETEVRFKYNIRSGLDLMLKLSAGSKTANLANRIAAKVWGLLPCNDSDVSDADFSDAEIEFMFARAVEIVKNSQTLAVA